MIVPVFVDTNVLVYARDAREPAKRARAVAWLELLWREQRGRSSMQVLSEYYVTLTRKLEPRVAPAEAWDDVSALMAWRPQPSDEALLKRGREIELRYRLGWWDCLIVAAAQVQGCALLLSEDLQDGGVYGGVTVRSPFTLGVSEPAATYAATSAAAPRHPPRGRPKRKIGSDPIFAPVRIQPADAVRSKLAALDLVEGDVADAVASARRPARKTRK